MHAAHGFVVLLVVADPVQRLAYPIMQVVWGMTISGPMCRIERQRALVKPSLEIRVVCEAKPVSKIWIKKEKKEGMERRTFRTITCLHDIPHCIIHLRVLEAYHEQHKKGLRRAFSVVEGNTR
jgi:hypothetical protein